MSRFENAKKRFPAQLGIAGASTLPAVSGLGLASAGARERMVERIAAEGITDPAVLQALRTVERHKFVESALVHQAYEDTSLPIGHGQTISKPSVVARMLALLHACPLIAQGRVLEIGTGCAYQAVLLSHLAREVYSMERIRALHELARKNLHPLRLKNLHLLLGDGMLGYPRGGPYAGIISAAGAQHLPQTWLEQLAEGGRLVAPLHTVDQNQSIFVIDRISGGFQRYIYEGVRFVPLQSGVTR